MDQTFFLSFHLITNSLIQIYWFHEVLQELIFWVPIWYLQNDKKEFLTRYQIPNVLTNSKNTSLTIS